MFKTSDLILKTSQSIVSLRILFGQFQKTSFSSSSKIVKNKSNKNFNKYKNSLNTKQLKKSINVQMDSQNKQAIGAAGNVTSSSESEGQRTLNGKDLADLTLDGNSSETQRNATRVTDSMLNGDEKNTVQSNKVYSRFRQWQNTELGSQFEDLKEECIYEEGFPFTLFSYNILAQDLLDEHLYLYRNHSSSALSWEHRLSKLKDEVLTVEPDILCLQEVQKDHLDALLASFDKLNYEYVYKKKIGFRTDGCAILYKRDLFHMAEHHSVEFYQPNTLHLDRDNVALIAKMCLKNHPSACFIVSTTHLLYNPNRQDVRLAQVQLLLAELDRYSVLKVSANNRPTRMPIILTGDFNLQPYSAPYRLITNGNLPYVNLTSRTLEYANRNTGEQLVGNEFLSPRLGVTDFCQHFDVVNNRYNGTSRLHHTERNSTHDPDEDLLLKYPLLFSTGTLSHNLNFTSVYKHRTSNEQPECSTYQDEWITVDYMFYSKYFSPKINSLCEGYLKLLSRYALPSVDKCREMGMIPNSELGSDHLSLGAKFYFKYPKSKTF